MCFALSPVLRTLLLSTSVLWSACSPRSTPAPAPTLDYEQASRALMQTVAPQLVGTWTLRQVQVTRQPLNYYQNLLAIKRDTLFQDLATLTLAPAKTPRQQPADARYPEVEGQVQFRGHDYPVYFQLRAHPDHVVDQQGPQALFLLETNYPVGTRQRDAGEEWLTHLGLLGDTYSLELVAGQPRMYWRGLNRGVSRIDLVK